MHDLPSLKVALTKTRALSINGRLTRLVPQLNLGGSPNWLFTSGKPNRYNPSGWKCVHFAELAPATRSGFFPGLPALLDQELLQVRQGLGLRGAIHR